MRPQGPPTVHYEVYTLGGQRWTLHARFAQGEREDALEEAKNVERTLAMAAKVVRELYYPANNYSEEHTIYAGNPALRERAGKPVNAPARGLGRSAGGNGAGSRFRAPDFARPPQSSMTMLVKLMLIVIASLIIAGALTGVVNVFFEKLPAYGMSISRDTASLLIFSTFVVAFLVTALPMAIKMIGWQSAGARSGRPKPKRVPPPAPPIPAPIVVEASPPPVPAEELEEEDEELEWNEDEADDTPLPPIEEEQQEQQAEPESETAAEEALEGAELDQQALVGSCQLATMRFLSDLLSEIKKLRPTLDAYNKFGIDLLLAGAIDVLGTQQGLEIEIKRKILKEAIEVMGTKSETAQAFADRYDEYLVEPRYLAMVQAGRSSMEAFLSGADMTPEDIARTFDGWNKPTQANKASPRIMTILFTDMVGSTDLTQSRGDHAAQHIVRRHNSIVRTVLAEFRGKEIKHTGDGIMASFISAANGVEAAVAIQRSIAEHNERYSEQQLHVRIGLNAGEPIEEEDDLFGTTVQLAARVCAKTGTDEILCTNVVRELSAGKGLLFLGQGAHPLKGFKEPVTLHEVVWQPGRIAALGAEAKADGDLSSTSAEQAPESQPNGVNPIDG